MRIFRLYLTLFLCLIISASFAGEKLIIEPDSGRGPLLKEINDAKSSIDVVMYGFTDGQFMSALVQAKKAGKKVQIILEPFPYNAETENEFAIKRIQAADIKLRWPANKVFKWTHQKLFLIDLHHAIIMTFNLTHHSFKNERNFALTIDDPEMIREIASVFSADWQHKFVAVKHPNLIWSPNNSREKILKFINNAQSNIKIYALNILDYQIVGALAKAAQKGKSVKIILSKDYSQKYKKLEYLRKAGVDIHFSQKYLIHAKVIIADNKRAILGSINLTNASIDKNRELSVITQDPIVIRELSKTFDSDWKDY